jgi:glycosyltransferase involved in cell wall biosynthesis
MRTGRVDLHLHSWASNVTSYYAANAFRIPESYSDPVALHRLLKSRGMDLVTLTDHNSIDGGKLLLDRGFEDVFLSAELTCRFPDGCHVHVTVANVTEAEFAECDRLRHDVFELVAWLEQRVATERPGQNRLTWFMTHPLMSTENRPYGREGSLSLAHVEAMALLVPGFEVRNGSRTRALNELTNAWLDVLDEPRMAAIAERFGRSPVGRAPWPRFRTGGSDDHAGINPGRTWTEFPYAGSRPTPNDLVDAMRACRVRPGGAHGGPVTLAHSLLKLVYEGARGRSARPRAGMALSGPVAALLELVFDAEAQGVPRKVWFAARALQHRWSRRRGGLGLPFERVLESEIYALLAETDFRERLARPEASVDDRIFLVMGTLINRVFARYVDNLRGQRSADLVGVIKEIVALLSSHLFVSLPYLASFLAQSSDARVAHDLRRQYGLHQAQKLVLVTDTYFDVNGVAATIQRMLRESVRRGVDLTVVTCIDAADRARWLADPETRRFVEEGRLRLFDAVTSLAFPEYDGLRIHFPPLLELLRYLQETGFTKMHISTPGIVGLTGLLAAKLLQLETASTYHTSVPEYVENYTRDVALEDLAWKYMIFFYHAVDEVLVPSRYIAKLLHKRGLRNRKLLILDRWVDCDRFSPDKRTPGFWRRWGLADEASLVKFVYVGRLGVEKNLALLADAFRALCARRGDVHLVIVGDGPYRATLEAKLAGLPVTWTGFLGGDDLPRALATCDVKLFPSITDTWGNAPLEAQACGLPVIVSEVGGPLELIRDGVTGIRVTGRHVDDLVEAMERLCDRGTRERMGRAARRFCLDNRVDEPFTAVFDAETYRRRVARAREATPAEGLRAPIQTDVLDLAAPSFDLVAMSADVQTGALA